jgi:hypothetical protein
MKTLVVKFVLISALVAAISGCSSNAGKVEADASGRDADVRAADARAEAAAKEQLLIPSGTILRVLLIDGLASDTSSAGDRFMASLAEPVVIDGNTLIPQGTKVQGRVLAVAQAGHVKGRATIRLELTDIVQGNRTVAITTDPFSATASSSTKRDVEIIGGGAGIGAVIGAIAGGGKGAGIGALVGGGGGTGVALAKGGNELRYGPETRLSFSLANSVQLSERQRN